MVEHRRRNSSVFDNSLSSNIRWLRTYCYHGFRDCFRFHRKDHLQLQPIDYLAFINLFLAKFLLEVCGAAGAIWGFTEVLTIRDPTDSTNNLIWRIVSLATFGIFLLRFWWHSKHYLEHDREFPPIKLKHRRLHKMAFVQIFSAKLVLEVFGAAGAIWGPSDALTLRTPNNVEEWRVACMVVALVAFVRWMFQICIYCLVFQTFLEQHPKLEKCLTWMEILVVRFVLVVCGAAGAIWGFSEVLTLRTVDTNYIWRPFSLSVGAVFTVRWMLQTFAYATGAWEDNDEPPSDDSDRELQSSKRDLELAETVAPVQSNETAQEDASLLEGKEEAQQRVAQNTPPNEYGAQ